MASGLALEGKVVVFHRVWLYWRLGEEYPETDLYPKGQEWLAVCRRSPLDWPRLDACYWSQGYPTQAIAFRFAERHVCMVSTRTKP